MATGIIESISKTSIIVSNDGKTATLLGPEVEKFARTVKLGDAVDYTLNETGTKLLTIGMATNKPAATVTTTPRSSSPMSKSPTALRDEAMQEDRYNGLRSW